MERLELAFAIMSSISPTFKEPHPLPPPQGGEKKLFGVLAKGFAFRQHPKPRVLESPGKSSVEAVRVEGGGGRDQGFAIVPVCAGVGINAQVLLVFWLPDQQPGGVGQEGTVDEAEAYMVRMDADLADPGTDRAAAFLEIIAEALRVDLLGGTRCDLCHQVAQLQDDLLQIGWFSCEHFLDGVSWEHILLAVRKIILSPGRLFLAILFLALVRLEFLVPGEDAEKERPKQEGHQDDQDEDLGPSDGHDRAAGQEAQTEQGKCRHNSLVRHRFIHVVHI